MGREIDNEKVPQHEREWVPDTERIRRPIEDSPEPIDYLSEKRLSYSPERPRTTQSPEYLYLSTFNLKAIKTKTSISP